ncbi:hypothetical protein BKA70DRAFT_1432646 [Coprinopsis sp. MPI-PUGE-AT-0042]|nr:hypothetical protein BKA70DRAFT_1432646 [Coprinopsis sp. MPI-PUGE-AT-0042]
MSWIFAQEPRRHLTRIRQASPAAQGAVGILGVSKYLAKPTASSSLPALCFPVLCSQIPIPIQAGASGQEREGAGLRGVSETCQPLFPNPATNKELTIEVELASAEVEAIAYASGSMDTTRIDNNWQLPGLFANNGLADLPVQRSGVEYSAPPCNIGNIPCFIRSRFISSKGHQHLQREQNEVCIESRGSIRQEPMHSGGHRISQPSTAPQRLRWHPWMACTPHCFHNVSPNPLHPPPSLQPSLPTTPVLILTGTTPAPLVPLRGFIHNVLKRSRTSGALIRQEKEGTVMQGDPEPLSTSTPATDEELALEAELAKAELEAVVLFLPPPIPSGS